MAKADHEYDVAHAKSRFETISCSGKIIPKAVVHNMEILKRFPSKIKLLIIKKCIKNESDDYVGLRYLDLYQECRKQRSEEGNCFGQQDMKRATRKIRTRDENIDFEEEEEKQAPPKKKKKENKEEKPKTGAVVPKPMPRAVVPKPVPDSLPEVIKSKIRELNGSETNWIITKRLFQSDVESGKTRLSMPLNQIDISFLREDEREILNKRKEGGIVQEIGVRLVGPTGGESTLALKKWVMAKPNGSVSYTYNLLGNWYKGVVVKYDLKMGELVQVWSFRVGEKLWFALVRISD